MPTKAKKLSIETASITIQVIKLDGHKLTKATFNQFQKTPPYDMQQRIEILSENFILGWVHDPPYMNWVVYEEDGEIYKMPFTIRLTKMSSGIKTEQFKEFVHDLGITQIYIAT